MSDQRSEVRDQRSKIGGLCVLLFVVCSLLFALSPSRVFGASGCSYPTINDSFANVVTGQILTAADYNKLLCVAEQLQTNFKLPNYTVATLPSSPVVGQKALVTDGIDDSDCSTGLGSVQVECIFKTGGWVSVGTGGGGGAPTSAGYITKTADGALSNEFALSSLATGLLKNTTGTGVPTIAVAGTDYVAPGGSGAGLTNLNASNLASGNVPLAQNTASVVSGAANYCAHIGGTDSYACTPPSTPSSLAPGDTFRIKAGAANVGAAELNVGTGPVGLRKWSGGSLVNLATNDIGANQVFTVVYDGTFFIVQSLGGSGGGGISGSGTVGKCAKWTDVTVLGDCAYYSEDGIGGLLTGQARFGDTSTNYITLDFTGITGAKTRTMANVDGKEAVTTGTLTNGNCAKFDSSARIVDHGGPCGGSVADIGARIYRTTNQTIPDSATTAMTFDAELWDTDSMHSTISQTERITFNTAGKYMIFASANFASTTGGRYAEVRLNGTTVIGWISLSSSYSVFVNLIYNFSASDYIEFRVFQDSGGNLDVEAVGNSPTFMVQKVA